MIVDLHKYLIVGSQEDMDRFFANAQQAGFMEFIGLSHKKALEMPQDAKTILSAIKIIRTHFVSSHAPFTTDLDPLRLAEEIVAWNHTHEKLLEEERLLHVEIARIAPFGDFSKRELDQVEEEGRRIFQFFCMKSDLAREMTLPPTLIYLDTEYDLDYFLSISKEKMEYPKMIEITIEKPIGELRERLHQLKLEKQKVERSLHDAARGLSYLQNGLLEYLNEHDLQMAKHDAAAPLGHSLFAIEAWVPRTKIKALYALLSGLDVYAEEIAIEERDRIPTYMENEGPSRLGEDLVQIYDTPASTDKDPSLWVLIFFSLFFAIIVADAGYGLVYLGIGLFLKWKYKQAAGAFRRFIKLILIASTACVIWGAMTASFFGLEISPTNPFRKMSFIHYMATRKAEYHLQHKDEVYQEYVKEFPAVATATDGQDFLLKAAQKTDLGRVYQAQEDFYDSILLELSLFIGCIHITLSFIRSMRRNWLGLGWIVFIWGGYLYFPSFVDATSLLNFMGWIPKSFAYPAGKELLFAGLGLVFIIALLQKKKWGALHELTNSIQVFADVLSYLRLYALALAGMIMADTFNDLAVKAGLVGGILVIVLGHAVNLTLTVMSGVIHGLRLNFLEWYHYSFEGGGRLFAPLRIRKVK